MAGKKCDVRHEISGKENACKGRIFNSLIAGPVRRKKFRNSAKWRVYSGKLPRAAFSSGRTQSARQAPANRMIAIDHGP